MTKLLFCELCEDISVPYRTKEEGKRSCKCGRHLFYWEDPVRGIFKVKDTAWDGQPRCWIIGIHNGFLAWDGEHNTSSIQYLIDTTPDTYLFNTIGSLIVRIRPGHSNDTGYEYTRVEKTDLNKDGINE